MPGRTNRSLSSRVIKSRHLDIITTSATVSAATTTAVLAANPRLVNATLLGMYPVGNQDQLVDSITLAADGSLTVVLAAAATAANAFNITAIAAK